MLDPVAVIAFSKVVEARSFTLAARSMGVTKGTISKLINKLEYSLKTKLLYRSTRRLSLTETGSAFLERTQHMADILEDAERTVASLEAEPKGTLKISAPMSFGHRYLGAVIAEFLGRYPAVRVDLALTDRFVDVIDEGFDLAIRIGVLKDSSLIGKQIAPFRPVVCASPVYLAANGTPRRPSDLERHNCLIYTLAAGPTDRWIFNGPKGREQVTPRGTLRANNGDVLLSAGVAGLGVLISPDFISAEALRARQLVPLLEGYRPANGMGAIHVVFPPNRQLSPKVRVFTDFMAARFTRPKWSA